MNFQGAADWKANRLTAAVVPVLVAGRIDPQYEQVLPPTDEGGRRQDAVVEMRLPPCARLTTVSRAWLLVQTGNKVINGQTP